MKILREFRTTSEQATEEVAAGLMERASEGEVFGLTGDLGAGKTVFVRGAVRALGGDPDQVHSPTFTVMNVYRARIPVHHFDLYRITDAADLESTGFYEFTSSGAVSLVEWIDRIPDAAAEVDFIISIRVEPDLQTRVITVLTQD